MISQKSISRINLAIIRQNRKGNCSGDYLGRRFIIDTNVKTISWENCTANGVTFGTAVRKMNGKYAIGNYEYQFTNNGLQITTKVFFTHNFNQVKKLIDEYALYGERRRIMDAHDQEVKWSVFAPTLSKPDWGDLEEIIIERPAAIPCKIKSSEKKAEFLAKCRKA